MPIDKAGIFPSPAQLRAFADVVPAGTPFHEMIETFTTACRMDGPFFLCKDAAILMTSRLLEPFTSLTVEERTMLAIAPINVSREEVRQSFLSYLTQYDAGQPVRLNLQLPYADPSFLARDLNTLEAKIQALDVYVWMGQRLGPLAFPDLADAVTKRSTAADLLEGALEQMSIDQKVDWEKELAHRQAKRRAAARAAERYGSRDRPTGGAGGELGAAMGRSGHTDAVSAGDGGGRYFGDSNRGGARALLHGGQRREGKEPPQRDSRRQVAMQ